MNRPNSKIKQKINFKNKTDKVLLILDDSALSQKKTGGI